MSVREMIDEMMEGIAFEDDATIERALERFASMSTEEITAEYREFMK
jgi:hypothetical protein